MADRPSEKAPQSKHDYCAPGGPELQKLSPTGRTSRQPNYVFYSETRDPGEFSADFNGIDFSDIERRILAQVEGAIHGTPQEATVLTQADVAHIEKLHLVAVMNSPVMIPFTERTGEVYHGFPVRRWKSKEHKMAWYKAAFLFQPAFIPDMREDGYLRPKQLTTMLPAQSGEHNDEEDRPLGTIPPHHRRT